MTEEELDYWRKRCYFCFEEIDEEEQKWNFWYGDGPCCDDCLGRKFAEERESDELD